jgi:hypothetical protein
MTVPIPTPPPSSAVDPLDYSFVFTQRPLLTPEEFIKECEFRGLTFFTGELGLAKLEALHRASVLVPFYRIAKDLHEARRVAREEDSSLESVLRRFRIKDRLPDHRAERTLFHPADQPFRPWRTFRRSSETGSVWTSIFLYSPYQLLAIPVLKEHMGCLHLRRHKGQLSDATFRFIEPNVFVLSKQQLTAIHELVPILSVLDPLFLPRIPDRTSVHLRSLSLNDWNHWVQAFDPIAFLQRIGWQSTRLVQVADRLLTTAHGIDPILDWQDVIRLGGYDKVSMLRKDALIAYDYRLAAELLLRLYESLADVGEATPLSPQGGKYWHPQRERLSTDRRELDQVLTDFGISPYPSLVLALESDTEMVIMPKMMASLGIPLFPSFIRIVNYGGIGKKFDLLVQYIVTPFLSNAIKGHSNQTLVPIHRPPTRFLLIVDSEGDFKGEPKRTKWRKERLGEVYSTLPREYQTDEVKKQLEEQLEDLVEIKSWHNEHCFEFANFTDQELADALGVPVTEIEQLRSGGKFNKKEIKNLWDKLRKAHYSLSSLDPPTKPELAERLWPVLEAKINTARQMGTAQSIPAFRIAEQAWELAASTRRGQVALFVSEASEVGL